jgi:hypothetical protein
VTWSHGMTWPSTSTLPRRPGPTSRASAHHSTATHRAPGQSRARCRRTSLCSRQLAWKIERASGPPPGPRPSQQPNRAVSLGQQDPLGQQRMGQEPNPDPRQEQEQEPGPDRETDQDLRQARAQVPTGPASSVMPPPRLRGPRLSGLPLRTITTRMSITSRRHRRPCRTSIQWPRAHGPRSSAVPRTCW